MSDYTKFIFPIVRREPIPDPYAGQQCCYEPGICMRLNCGLPRWHHPDKGETVLCEEHAREVYEKKAKAPPLIPTFIPPLPESLRYPRGGVFLLDLYTPLQVSRIFDGAPPDSGAFVVEKIEGGQEDRKERKTDDSED